MGPLLHGYGHQKHKKGLGLGPRPPQTRPVPLCLKGPWPRMGPLLHGSVHTEILDDLSLGRAHTQLKVPVRNLATKG
jgi:hypothetical protein